MRAIPVTLSVVLLLALSSCASAEPTASLADAKSLVQLVRNEAGARIADVTTAEIAVVDDVSEACADEGDDPDGRERRWRSTSLVTLDSAAGDSLETIYADLINSFSANGWSEVTYGGGGAVELRKPESDASLNFLAAAEDADAAAPATISVTISSGCVQTQGATSDEVATLEKAGS